MATVTKRGKAQFSGIPGTFDVIVYPEQQSAKATHQYDEQIVKDKLGQSCGWKAQDEKVETDFNFKLLGDTNAHAITGASFLAPLAIITLSGFDIAAWNTTYQLLPGTEVDLKNDTVGDMVFKMRRYVDATQNTLAAAIPA